LIHLVSIIIPNYNHAAFLQQRLESVFHQTYQNFEVILLDDASTDASVEILKKYQYHPKVAHFIINETNSGSPFKQWQKGISLAKGEYIWIAESDDYCEPDFLETLMQSFTNQVDLVYCQTKDVDEKGVELLNRMDYTADIKPNLWKDDFEMAGKEFIKSGLLIKNVIPNASAVVFKKSLVKPGSFSDTLLHMQMCGDWFFWVKLVEKTTISFIKKPLNFFRNHPAITRIHNKPDLKRKRSLEEATIRRFAYEQYGLASEHKNRELYKKWFKLHGKMSFFKPVFYKIKQPSTGMIDFISKFIKFKLNNN